MVADVAGQHVVHDDQADVPAQRALVGVQPEELGQERLGVLRQVLAACGKCYGLEELKVCVPVHASTHQKVAWQQLTEKVCFLPLHGLHDEIVIRRCIEQRTTRARIADLLQRFVA